MDLTERLQNVAVLGAAGKMGSGIALLLAQELARTRLTPEGKGKVFRLALIDLNEAALDGLLELPARPAAQAGREERGRSCASSTPTARTWWRTAR